MKRDNHTLHICCTFFLLSCLSVVSMANNTNMPIQDTVCIDSMKTAYHNEINFILDKIENDYVSGKRGMSDRQWNDKIKKSINRAIFIAGIISPTYILCQISEELRTTHTFNFLTEAHLTDINIFQKKTPYFRYGARYGKTEAFIM